MSEDPAERAAQYIANFERALRELTPLKGDANVKAAKIAKVYDTINRYLQDARFYLQANKPATSLASIAYAEGLLDALKFLNLSSKVDRGQ